MKLGTAAIILDLKNALATNGKKMFVQLGFSSFFFWLILSALPVYAQEENRVTITTYYPSPHGVYKALRLAPRDDYPTTGLGEGLLVYRSTDNAPAYYNNSGSWVVLASKTDITRIENMVTAANDTANSAESTAVLANEIAATARATAESARNLINQKLLCQNYTCPSCPACNCTSCQNSSSEVLLHKTFYVNNRTGRHGDYSGTLSCPDGKIIVAGSVSCTSKNGNLIPDDSFPVDKDTWLGDCTYKNLSQAGSTTDGSLTISITCSSRSR